MEQRNSREAFLDFLWGILVSPSVIVAILPVTAEETATFLHVLYTSIWLFLASQPIARGSFISQGKLHGKSCGSAEICIAIDVHAAAHRGFIKISSRLPAHPRSSLWL